MCTVLPVPAIAPPLPWNAPGLWAAVVAIGSLLTLVFWVMRALLLLEERKRSTEARMEGTLYWAGIVLLLASYFGYFLVYLPAHDALDRWWNAAKQQAEVQRCSLEVVNDVWTRQTKDLDALSSDALLLAPVAAGLVCVSVILTSRRHAQEQAQKVAAH